MNNSYKNQLMQGSIELVVVGLLAALLVVLALPLFLDAPEDKPAAIDQAQEVS